MLYVHVTLVPFIEAAGELKTKPTQHSVNELRRIGIHPDIVVCRSREPLSHDIRDKIALFTDVDRGRVIASPDVPDVYLVPQRAAGARASTGSSARSSACRAGETDLGEWDELVRPRSAGATASVEIALVGKYVKLQDAYLSVHEALKHAGIHHGCDVRVRWVDAEDMSLEEARPRCSSRSTASSCPAASARAAGRGRSSPAGSPASGGIPYLGICLGMHVAVSEFARHVVGLEGANSTEMDPETPYPVIDLLPEQKEIEDLGGTMRLGAQAVELAEGTRAREALRRGGDPRAAPAPLRGQQPLPRALVEAGLVVSGTFQEGRLVEIIELPDHPWFVASQFHPEFKSRPTRPAPLFRETSSARRSRTRTHARPRAAGVRDRRSR